MCHNQADGNSVFSSVKHVKYADEYSVIKNDMNDSLVLPTYPDEELAGLSPFYTFALNLKLVATILVLAAAARNTRNAVWQKSERLGKVLSHP